MAAFAWWTYSLVNLSVEVHVDDNDKLAYKAHKAKTTLLRGSRFKQDDDTVFAEMKVGTHIIFLDTATMRKKIKEEYPYTEVIYDGQQVSVIPTPNIVEKLENDKNRKVRMYLIEGIVFLLLLMFGFSWLYNRLTSIIKLNQQKSNFLLAVTHELKTPMASVKLFLQTIQRRELTKEQMNPMIDNCIEDVNRLNDLAENMLLATRIEGKSYQYNYSEVDLSALLSGISENYMKKYEAYYTIEDSIDNDIEISADVFALTLAINNLIENALKYSPKKSTIKIIARNEGDKAVMQITDEGDGIPKDERINIFKQFYRVGNESTRTSKGTGLGLYIVKEIVDNHKATIEVLDNTPKGSIFKITFKALT